MSSKKSIMHVFMYLAIYTLPMLGVEACMPRFCRPEDIKCGWYCRLGACLWAPPDLPKDQTCASCTTPSKNCFEFSKCEKFDETNIINRRVGGADLPPGGNRNFTCVMMEPKDYMKADHIIYGCIAYGDLVNLDKTFPYISCYYCPRSYCNFHTKRPSKRAKLCADYKP